MAEITVFTSEEKVKVEQGSDSHVFQRTGDGLEYDLDESNSDYFPDKTVISRVEEETGEDVADIFPVEFDMYAADDSNTHRLLESAGLPTEDEDLKDLFWYYPGELEIHGELDRKNGDYTFEPVSIEYEGTTFTPDE